MTADTFHLDPRARHTLEALQSALGEHMRTQQIGEISVSEICRTAGVHRTTFYKHFESVADLAALAVTDLLHRVSASGTQHGARTYATWFTALVEHIGAGGETYRSIVGPKGDPALQRAMSEQFVARARRAVRNAGASREDLGMDPEAAAHVLGYGAFGAVCALAVSDTVEPAETARGFFAALPSSWAAVVDVELGPDPIPMAEARRVAAATGG